MTTNADDQSDDQDLTQSLAHEITIRRNDQGLTLEDLADRSKIHRTTLSLIERRKRGLSIKVAAHIANGLGYSLSDLILGAEQRQSSNQGKTVVTQRVAPECNLRNKDKIVEITQLTSSAIKSSIERTYQTFDMIDQELTGYGSEPLSHLVEYANLSSMLGNILGASLADQSDGLYTRNRPHTYPDLIPQRNGLPDLELKVALGKNSPKGHLPKKGTYITFRYVLASPQGVYERTRRGTTVWIWEVRVGKLDINDFAISNTEGDSGKTAVIKGQSFKNMTVVYYDPRFFPYAREWNNLKPLPK